MSEAPFVQFVPSDWLAGTAGMTPAERGVYITLVCLIYENAGPIERLDRRLARVCGCSASAFVRILNILLDEGKIMEVDDNFLTNDRCERQLRKRSEKSQKARRSVQKRWSATDRKRQRKQRMSDTDAIRTQYERNTNHNHIEKKGENDLPKPSEDTLEIRIARAERWIETGHQIPPAMDRSEVVSALIDRGHDSLRLKARGFTVPESSSINGNVVNLRKGEA